MSTPQSRPDGTRTDPDQRFLLSLLDGIDDVIYVADPDTYELLHVNEPFKKAWGEEVAGRKCYQVLQNRDEPCPFCTNDRIFGEHLGQSHVWEFQNEVTGRWYRCSDKAVSWTDGRMVRFELASDITEMKQAAGALRESEERFARVARVLPDMIYCMSLPDGQYEYVSEASTRIFGFAPEEFMNNKLIVQKAIHPDWRDYFRREWEKLLDGRASPVYEYQIIRPDGEVRWLNQRNVVLRGEDDHPSAIWGIVTDVTDRKGMEQELQERVKELTCMQQVSRAIERSDVATEQLVEEVARSLAGSLQHPESTVARIRLEDAEYRTGDLEACVATLTASVGSKDAVTGLVEVGYRNEHLAADEGPFLREERNLVNAVADMLGSFVTRRQAENQLRQHQEHLEKLVDKRTTELASQTDDLKRLSAELTTIMDSVPGLVFYKDRNNRYVRVNQYVADAHKMRKDELEGTSCFDLYPREQAQAYLDDDLAVIRAGQPKLNIEEPWETENGTRWVNTSKIPYVDEHGEVTGVIGVSMDVTERKQAELEIREKTERLEEQNWLRTGQARLNDVLRGEQPLDTLCQEAVAFVTEYVGARMGALFVVDRDRLILRGRYAYRAHEAVPESFALGEGLVGQAAQSRKTLELSDPPETYILVGSALGQSPPRSILVVPFFFGDRIKGVIELASLEPFTDQQRSFLDQVVEAVGIAVQTAQSRQQLQDLLEESQRMSEELQAQQEELKVANEELEGQTERLSRSEARLKTQQEELQVTNEELEEKNELLECQKRDVEQARKEITGKADELARASKYKSEFLANMSHELRTPLNSLLLLSRSLSENTQGNLTQDQVESIQIIHQGGNELLSLINDILDLSKIEAGRMDLRFDEIALSDLAESTRTAFQRMAADRGLAFEVAVAGGAPGPVTSDRKRVEQVIRNLVANAIKFTDQGRVSVTFGPIPAQAPSPAGDLDPGRTLSIAVQDTGIGIDPAHQKLIFEAFQQADGGTARRFGGTGLGLSIVRELTRILGGEIQLVSEPGQGSTFYFYLPVDAPKEECEARPESTSSVETTAQTPTVPPHVESIPDDRDAIAVGDRSILIIEDDSRFAAILADQCRQQGFKILAAATGETGVELAREHVPQGVLLDLKLPGADGQRVLEMLKEHARTRHIPVHIMSVEEPSARILRKGAIGYVQKPVTAEQIQAVLQKIQETACRERTRSVLVVEDDQDTRRGIVELIADTDVMVDEVSDGQSALEALLARSYDCMVLDLGLQDMDGTELLQQIADNDTITAPPVIVYTARDLTRDEDFDLRSYSNSIVIKDVRSDERLLDEVSLFLHRVVADMPESKRRLIANLHDADTLLHGKKILLVDDDMRALFALSRVLTERGMQTLKAQNGQKALELLEQEPEVDVVLMDIMMPVLDGYETMKRIRAQDRFKNLPIIALTAKAMKGDHERCIVAGASDYLPKPVDQDRLLSMLRVWLYR